MGNCLLGGTGDGNQSVIKVTTSNGGVMEFYAPITVELITDEFPGHGIFRGHDLFWTPLPHCELLVSGESYHLLPLLDIASDRGHVRSNSAPSQQLAVPSYRMSFDSCGLTKQSVYEEVPRPCGFWKVKLVISTEQLLGILSEEAKTEELIESVRTVAKCGSVFGGGSSDQWSRSSSRKAFSSSKDALLEFS